MTSAKTQVFFRDDDVAALTGELERFVDLFLGRGIPVHYLAIPSQVTEDAATWMKARRRSSPDLIRIHQHGHLHEQTIGGERRWSEFDGGRPYPEQHEAIAAGRAACERLFGAEFDADVFTPPCHKYDRSTLRALESLGFSILSAAAYTGRSARIYYTIGRSLRRVSLLGRRVSYHGRRVPGLALVELSTSIDVDMEKSPAGQFIEKGAERLLADFRRARRAHDVVGVLLHHQTYTRESKFAALAAFLTALGDDPSVEFCTMETLAARILSR